MSLQRSLTMEAGSNAASRAGAPRILSLILHHEQVSFWNARVTRIDTAIPEWRNLSALRRFTALLATGYRFDVVLFCHRPTMAFLYAAATWLGRTVRPRPRLIFATLLCDVSAFSPRLRLSRALPYQAFRFAAYWIFCRLFDRIIVHTSGECELLAGTFHTPPERFCFLPYCVRADAPGPPESAGPSTPDPSPAEVVAAGRNRDWQTFLRAVDSLEARSLIIAGAADRPLLERENPRRVPFRVEIPFMEYRSLIRSATVFVIPLFADRYMRSLGQVSVFEAVAAGVPVVAADTFQVREYFKAEEEILYYEPGRADDLRRQILRLLQDASLRRRLACQAFDTMQRLYTEESYTRRLIDVCEGRGAAA